MRYALIALLALLAGCSWSDQIVKEMKALPPGKSFGYMNGFEDGCKTGIAERGGIGFDKPRRSRDDRRIGSEPEYAQGWDEGARGCADRHAGLVLVDRLGYK